MAMELMMKQLVDAQGEAIMRAYQSKPSFEVFERDDGYVTVAFGPDQYLTDYKDWRKHEKIAIEYARGRCLDIGCGAGRVGVYLQKKGLEVVGIDSSKGAIDVCKKRGLKNVGRVTLEEFMKTDRSKFDTIIMFGNNFGILENLQKGRLLLEELCKITSQDAIIIAESRNPYSLKNPVHYKYYERNVQKGNLPGQFRMRIRFLQYATHWFDYIYVSKKEMENMLDGTGWKIMKFIDQPDYAMSGQYIAIIEKV